MGKGSMGLGGGGMGKGGIEMWKGAWREREHGGDSGEYGAGGHGNGKEGHWEAWLAGQWSLHKSTAAELLQRRGIDCCGSNPSS